MSREQIQKTIDKLPRLTDFGVGLFDHGRGLSPAQFQEKFQKEQETLLNSTDAFFKTCEWLSEIEKIKTINSKHTSYGLKHIAEKDIGYITNGVFIAAAIHCGFDFKTRAGSPNVIFNMSEKSIKNIIKRISFDKSRR